MTRTLLVLCCVFLAVAYCQKRPQFSQVFEAKLFLQHHNSNGTVEGEGHWVQDRPVGKAFEFFNFQARHEQSIYRLQRYDLGFAYQVDLHSNASCVKTALQGQMPDEWAWIANATYNGTTTHRDWSLDWWQYTTGYSKVELAVDHNNPNRPIFLIRRSNEGVLHVEFVSWYTVKPHDSWFNVPSKCSSTTWENNGLLSCLSRSTIISRAQSWVNAHVPYNQGATYDGYREDCSGFVSMAWEAMKPGYSTSTLHNVAHPISRSELQPGDVLLCASEHVVLFGGWVNSNEYTAYEETRPGEGTVKRTTPYPYWYNTGCFLPYRFNSVC